MDEYKAMYAKLYNTITDTIVLLKQVQQETEEMYISADTKSALKIPNELESENNDENGVNANLKM